ncbi:unnamed protein product [Prorocentrum cordatum]|uniref:Uncharacterized protein n=1 Tax=Prorocentrum cordatum TaxID=2364126 RepID=A0ABN9Q198_9DINO|nr:unnamed protein product [Polarella glacialis]
MVTHHLDLHDGDLEEALGLRSVGPRGGIGTVYGRLRRTDMDEFDRRRFELLRAARECAEQIRAEEGLPAPGDGGPMLLGDAAAGDPAGAGLPPLPAPAGPPALGAGDSGDALRNSEATEARDGYEIDDLISRVRAKVVFGDRGVPELSAGNTLAVALTGTTSRPTPPDHNDILGDRSRPFPGAVNAMQLVSVEGWPIVGPRTCLWLPTQLVKLNFTPMQRCHWWRQILGLSAEDTEVDEHTFLSEVLEVGCQIDQVCPPSLVFFEMVCWRCQLWEEVKEAVILKERREGREEKLLAAGEGANPSGQPGPKKKPKKPKTAPVDYPVPQFCVMDIVDSSRDLLPIPLGVGLDSVLHGSGAGRVDLGSLTPEPLLKMLEAGHGLLREPAEVQSSLGSRNDNLRYLDPKLARRGCFFGRALSELFDAGAARVDPGNALEEIGLFFARRKDHRLRLIADARAANLHFVEPAYAELASPEALAAIECDGPDMIGFCSGGVDACSYRYELPEWARRYFTLPTIKAQCLPAALRGRSGLARDTSELKFRFRVAPTGWSWAVHLTQQGHLHAVERALQSGRWVLDERPGVDLRHGDAKVLYIDNFAVASVDQACDGSKAELLGCELGRTTGRWRIKPKRLWRLMGALDYLLDAKGRKVTGREVERVLGRIVAACTLRPGLKRQPLRPTARRELFWARSLLPCIVGEMGKAWSSTVTAYDASPWGYGVVETEWEPAAVASRGRFSERARFRGPLAAAGAPWDRALEAEAAQAPGAALILTGRVSEFPEVSARALTEATWRVVGCGRWRRREAIHCLEAASVCWAARRIVKHARRRGQRHLVLGDNMFATLALAKGRAPDHRLLLACRVVFAVSVAADIRLRCRWLPSEWNPSDQASRRRQPPGLKHERGRGQHAEEGADGPVADSAVHLGFRLRPSRRERQSIPLGAPSDPRLGLTEQRGDVEVRRRVEGGRQLVRPRLPRLAAEKARLKTRAIYLGFVEWLFDKGGAAATAKRVGPALLWGDPRLALGSLRTTFPVLQQALKGRVQRRPEFWRPPLPRVSVAAAARELLDLNMGMAALGIMIAFETYMRPSELLALLTDHVVLPIPGEAGAARWLTFVIRAQEALVPSKTNAFDISVPLDLGRQCWLARCMEVVVRRRGPGSSLLGLACADLAAAFKTVLKGVGAPALQGTLYSLRRGGASHDRSMGAGPLAAVQQRGRWRAFQSATRYEKHGRLGLELQKLGPARLALLRQRSAGIELACERCFGLRWRRRAAGSPE